MWNFLLNLAVITLALIVVGIIVSLVWKRFKPSTGKTKEFSIWSIVKIILILMAIGAGLRVVTAIFQGITWYQEYTLAGSSFAGIDDEEEGKEEEEETVELSQGDMQQWFEKKWPEGLVELNQSGDTYTRDSIGFTLLEFDTTFLAGDVTIGHTDSGDPLNGRSKNVEWYSTSGNRFAFSPGITAKHGVDGRDSIFYARTKVTVGSNLTPREISSAYNFSMGTRQRPRCYAEAREWIITDELRAKEATAAKPNSVLVLPELPTVIKGAKVYWSLAIRILPPINISDRGVIKTKKHGYNTVTYGYAVFPRLPLSWFSKYTPELELIRDGKCVWDKEIRPSDDYPMRGVLLTAEEVSEEVPGGLLPGDKFKLTAKQICTVHIALQVRADEL